jgi:hypothetical protein
MQLTPSARKGRLQPLGRALVAAAVSLALQLGGGSACAQTTGFAWGVVVGADRSLQAARDEARQAAAQIGRTPTLYSCNDWIRTIFVLTDRREAFQVLAAAQQKIRPSAYLVDLRVWCPGKRMVN